MNKNLEKVSINNEVLTPRKQLLNAADKLQHYDNIYYDNMRFVRKHLEVMAGLADKYEAMGYEIIVEADTSENGSIRVFLKPKDQLGDVKKQGGSTTEIKIYETYWGPGDRRQKIYDDPYPTEEKISELFESAISRIEAFRKNKPDGRKTMKAAI